VILAPVDPNLNQSADADPVRRDMVSRMDMARAKRDDGMGRALDHAERDVPTWGEQALAYLRCYAETHDRFPAWFVTHAAELTGAVPTPPTLKSWGAILAKAARDGWLKNDGYTQHPQRHASPTPIWLSLIYQQEAA